MITSSATSVDEGTTVTFTVTAAAAASVDRTFDYQIKGAAQGVAVAAQTADFSATNGTFTIKANQVTGTILVTPLADNAPDDYYEGFNVSIIDNTFNVIKTSDTVVIRNTSYAPAETKLTVSATDVVTNSGQSDVTFIGQVGQTTTLQASDQVTGNGRNDKLRVVTDDSAISTIASVSGFTVSGVKTLEVQAQASGGTTLGLENVNGISALRTSASTDSLTVNNVNNVVDLSFDNTIGKANITVNYTDAAVAGTADVQNIALNKNTLGVITLSNTTTKATTRTGIETISIDTTGTGGESTLDGLTTAATVLNVKGNQDLTIGGVVNSLADVNAASFTGKLAITAGTAATNITVVGGTNDDTIDVSAATGGASQKVITGTGNNTVVLGGTFSQVDSIIGNTGVDTLSVTNIASIQNVGSPLGETFKNSSALDTVKFTLAQGTDTFNADAYVAVTNTTGAGANAAGISTYNFTQGLTGAVVLSKVADNINIGVEQNAAGGQALTLSKPTGVTAGTSTINFTNTTNKLLGETLNSLTVASDATLKINATDTDTTVLTGGGVNTLTITTLVADAALTTLTVAGNENVVLGNDLYASGATKLATITSTTTGAFTVNSQPVVVGSAAAQALTVVAAGTDNTITTGAGADVITANGTKNITIQAGNGNNTVSAVGAATFATAITTGTGNDLITVTGNGTNTINTGITGDDIVTVTGTGSSTVTVGTGGHKITFTAGTNTVNIASTDFTSTDTINGGTGIDTVAISTGAVALTDGSFDKLSSVEQLSLSNNANTVTLNQIANARGLNTVIFNGGTNNLLVGEGFVNALTVNVATNGNDNITATVNGVTSASAITVKAAIASITTNDTITGGSSTGDTLELTADSDVNGANLFGVTGVETIKIKSSVAAGVKTLNTATVQLGSDNVVANGKTLTIDASDLTVTGSDFIFQGNAEQASALTILAGGANNTIWGGSGSDTITIGSGAGASSIQGGIGSDIISLNTKAGVVDKVYYLTANDSNSLIGTDTIYNFTSGEDKIDLASLGGNGPLTIAHFKGNQFGSLNVLNAIADGGAPDAGNYVFDTSTNKLIIDVDGSGTITSADLQIYLPGVTTLSTTINDVVNTGAVLAITNKDAYVNGNVATANYTTYPIAPSSAILGGPGNSDTLRLLTAADLSNAGNISGFENFTLDTNASVSTTLAQWTALRALNVTAAGTTAGTDSETVAIKGVGGTLTAHIEVENYDASLATSAVTFTAQAPNGTFTGSAYDDVVKASVANLNGFVYDGNGSGADTLNVTDNGGIPATLTIGNAGTGGTVTNVERLVIGDSTNSASNTIAFDVNTGISSVTSYNSADTISVTNLVGGGTVSLGNGANALTGMTVALATNATASFVSGSDVTDSVTYAAGVNLSAAGAGSLAKFSGFEAFDFGAVAAVNNKVTLVTGVKSLTATTGLNADITFTGTGAQVSALTTVTNTTGTGTFNFTLSDAATSVNLDSAHLTIDGTAPDIDVLKFVNTGSNTLTVDSVNIAKITGIVDAAGTGDNLILTDTATVVITTFDAFENLTAATGNTAIDIIDDGVAVVRTITGNAGNNTISLGIPTAAKTVNLAGGTDTVEADLRTSSGIVTVSGFTPGAGGDVFNGLGVSIVLQPSVVATTGTVNPTAFASNTAAIALSAPAFQIAAMALNATGEAGPVEAAILAAGIVLTDQVNTEGFYAILDNGVDTGIYRVALTATAGTSGVLDQAGEMSVTLVGQLTGVADAGLLTAANFI